MIYSGSGSNSEFSEFRIHADPDPTLVIYVYMEIVNKTTLNSIIKKNLSTICHLYFILQSYSTQSPEFTEKLHFYFSALAYLAGSGSRTIIPDPNPVKISGSNRIRIHCKFHPVLNLCKLVYKVLLLSGQHPIESSYFFSNTRGPFS